MTGEKKPVYPTDDLLPAPHQRRAGNYLHYGICALMNSLFSLAINATLIPFGHAAWHS
jgi:hypothetical protein